MGCSRISEAVRLPNAVTRANFSRRDHRASFKRAVRGSMDAELEASGGVLDSEGVRESKSEVVGSMRYS
jgi:hypothetical protein